METEKENYRNWKTYGDILRDHEALSSPKVIEKVPPQKFILLEDNEKIYIMIDQVPVMYTEKENKKELGDMMSIYHTLRGEL